MSVTYPHYQSLSHMTGQFPASPNQLLHFTREDTLTKTTKNVIFCCDLILQADKLLTLAGYARLGQIKFKRPLSALHNSSSRRRGCREDHLRNRGREGTCTLKGNMNTTINVSASLLAWEVKLAEMFWGDAPASGQWNWEPVRLWHVATSPRGHKTRATSINKNIILLQKRT